MQVNDIIDFWFHEMTDKQRFSKDEMLDATIRSRFGHIHRAAVLGELFEWRNLPIGRLAEIIVLDQFSRNIFRGRPESFAHDPQALVLAQEMIGNALDQQLTIEQRSFVYKPFMHSESKLIHEQAERLYSQPGLENALAFEKRHKVIIERFGRYPHRNAILGRVSNDEEIAFMLLPGSSF